MKKQTFSLRKSKLGTVSALVGLSIVGAAAYADGSVLAAETPTPAPTTAAAPTTEPTAPVAESKTTVTKEQLEKAEKKVLDTKAVIEENEKKRPELAEAAKKADSEEKNAAEKLSEATPTAIQKAKDDATKAAEAVKTAEADVKAKKATQETLTKDVATKQADADKANNAVDAAAKKVKDLENGTPSLTPAEKAKADAEKAKADAEKAKADTEKAKADADKADADAAKKVTTLNNDLTTKKQVLSEKEKALKDLGEAPQAYDFSDVKFNLGADFAAALNERAKLMGEYTGRSNELNLKDDKVKANSAKLADLAKINMAKNTYSNTADTREVDIWNLTDEQKREINLFGLHIVNQIREQLGNPKVKTTVGMEKFANEAAAARNKKYGKVTTTYATHDYDGINAAAKANGLSYTTGDNQNQSDIMFANAKTWENTVDNKTLIPASKGQIPKSVEEVMRENTRRPVMTMGKLKEYIFEAYKLKMFTNNKNSENQLDTYREWENALSIGGSIAYRKAGTGAREGRKASEYNATTITASIRFDPNPRYSDGYKAYRYFNILEIFVQNFQTAGENTAPGQDTNSIVTDPSKFDATEIKNDPTAAKEYITKKQAAEKAVKDAQAEVTTAQNNLAAAKQYKPQLPAAEKALADATSKLTAAEKALQEAETNLNNLRKGVTNKADELNKAKAALATAKEEAKKANDALTAAKTKLVKADADVKDTAALVMTKVSDKEKAEELVRSLENAKENYAKAKAAKEAVDAKLKELDTYLAETRAELTKLEAEYNELLKHYVPEQPEPKPKPEPKPGNPGTPGSQKTPATPEQPKAPVQSQVNAKLKALPNTGQSENGVASVAALAALAIAARLRKAKN